MSFGDLVGLLVIWAVVLVIGYQCQEMGEDRRRQREILRKIDRLLAKLSASEDNQNTKPGADDPARKDK